MAEAMTTPKNSKAQVLAMTVSFLLALPLAAILLVHPALMLDANGHYNHSQLMLVMIGISGGFIHGVTSVIKITCNYCIRISRQLKDDG